MKSKQVRLFTVLALLIVLLGVGSSGLQVQAQTEDNPDPPNEVVKLIFLHHSVGENWLTDDHGGLGLALQANNYYVSDTYYGWGPDGIGDSTDILQWPMWFTGPDSNRYMNAVYNESDANAAGYEYYTRTITDPGGENQIVVFKSCYPNSDMGGSPNDNAAPGDDLTVASAKYVYNQLLTYFATRPDKLFIVITAPPMQNPSEPENARAFNTWLMNDWLQENDYPYNNVAVFDFYNVLTHPDNHHRYHNGQIEYIISHGNDTLYYDSDGDDHPNAAGSQKATDEFVELLNIFYHRWQAGGPPAQPPAQTQPTEEPTQDISQPADQQPGNAPPAGGMIDDFETGTIPDTDYWVPYWDEAVDTTIQCRTVTDNFYGGTTALQIDFNVLEGSWASCELLFYQPNNWSSEGLSFYIQASEAGLPFGVLFYYQQGDDRGTATVWLETQPDSVGQWGMWYIPWSDYALQDSLVYPEVGLGMAFVFDGDEGEANNGTIWIDDVALVNPGTSPAPPADQPDTPSDTQGDEYDETETPANNSGRRRLPFCGGAPALVLFMLLGMVWIQRKKR